ncbi:unnamed protein product [Meloidogyne enterolobii]|uniref:Uncharacterized protein n=1 Tax=Meloidogyne enterolobii TaxID=390850 RepID=A0ACB1AL01_MELEN
MWSVEVASIIGINLEANCSTDSPSFCLHMLRALKISSRFCVVSKFSFILLMAPSRVVFSAWGILSNILRAFPSRHTLRRAILSLSLHLPLHSIMSLNFLAQFPNSITELPAKIVNVGEFSVESILI